MQLSNIRIEYHRNGISGEPFYACLFDCIESGEERRMMAVVFSEDSHCAVLDVDLLAQGNIVFGENSWRGDRYESLLRKAIKEWRESL